MLTLPLHVRSRLLYTPGTRSKARPTSLLFACSHKQHLQHLIELVMDEGRRPYAMLQGGAEEMELVLLVWDCRGGLILIPLGV